MIEFAGTFEESLKQEMQQSGRMTEKRAASIRERIAKHQERFDKSGMEYDADWIRVYKLRLEIHGYKA